MLKTNAAPSYSLVFPLFFRNFLLFLLYYGTIKVSLSFLPVVCLLNDQKKFFSGQKKHNDQNDAARCEQR